MGTPTTRGIQRRALVLFCASLLGAAAGLAACGDDAPDDAPTADGRDAAPSPVDDAARPSLDAQPPPPSAPPTFCDGIIFHASFDEGVEADLGGGVTRDAGGVSLVPGRFGSGLSLVDTARQGALVFYDRGDGGVPPIYAETEGTLAYWYKRTAEGTGQRSHVRPLGGGTAAAGLVVASVGGTFGLWTDLGGDRVLAFSEADLSPFVRGADFDHFAFGWKRGDVDAGASPLARMVVNGGAGDPIGDASVDAAQFADATPDDAGNLRVPYRAQTSAPWEDRLSPFSTLRLGGVTSTSAQGVFDDLTLWNRVLTFEEVGALYRGGASVRALCKL